MTKYGSRVQLDAQIVALRPAPALRTHCAKGAPYKSLGSHLEHQQAPVLIKDDNVKWLDFGMTPAAQNLQPHPGFVLVKSGYSEAIAWHNVRLTKQRNVDLTTDGLWAMLLNTGRVPVKARTL